MDPQYKRLLNSNLWADQAPVNRKEITDPNITPVLSRAAGWTSDFGTNGRPPDRRRWNQWIRELQGAAHTKRAGIPQYTNEVDYDVGAICAVNTNLYRCVRANGPSSVRQSPVDDVQVSWLGLNGSILRPSQPRFVIFDNTTINELFVQWRYGLDRGDAIIRFELQYKRSSESSWSPATPISVAYPAYRLTGLVSGDTYNVRVRAVNSVGESDWEITNAETIGGVPIPEPPNKISGTVPSGGLALNLRATGHNGYARMNWVEPYNGGYPITSYRVQWREFGGAWLESNIRVTEATARSYRVDGLTNSTRYEFRVQAGNTLGYGLQSNLADATPMGPVLATKLPILQAPTLLAVPVGGFTATPNWKNATGAITASVTGYEWQATRTSDTDWSHATNYNAGRVWTQEGHFPSGAAVMVRFRLGTSIGTTGWSPAALLSIGGAYPDPPGRVNLIVNHNPGAGTYLGSVLVQLGAGHNNNGSPVTAYSMRVVFQEGGIIRTNSTGVFNDSSSVWENNRGTSCTVFGACRNSFGWSFNRQGNTVYIPF